jgi:hypothetical protein
MKLKHTIFVGLIGCFAFSLTGCSKVSNGIPPAPTANRFLKGADGPPLWLVDNVEISDPQLIRARSINSPNDIKSISVLSPSLTNDLVSLYGPKAKNGVVLVVTTKGIK